MKKLFSSLIFIFSLLLLLLLSIYPQTNEILAAAITNKLKTKVKISQIQAKLFDQLKILELRVTNLAHYPTPLALEIGKIELKMPFLRLFNNVTEIDAILIHDFTIFCNYSNGISNWQVILKNLNHSTANLEDRSFIDTYSIIHKLAISNIEIYIENEDGTTRTHHVDKIYLKDIKTLNGQLTRRVTEAILSQFFFNFQNILNVPIQMPKNLLTNPIEGSIDEIESLIKIF